MSAIKKHGKQAIVEPDSDILSSNRDVLRDELKQLIDEGIHDIILDLNKVGRIDSSGLSVFIATYNSLKPSEGSLSLIKANETIKKLLTLTRFDRYITID